VPFGTRLARGCETLAGIHPYPDRASERPDREGRRLLLDGLKLLDEYRADFREREILQEC
jgi:hypothetical protein